MSLNVTNIVDGDLRLENHLRGTTPSLGKICSSESFMLVTEEVTALHQDTKPRHSSPGTGRIHQMKPNNQRS